MNVEASLFDPVLATLRLTSVRSGRESWEYYEMKVSVYKKPPQFVYDASLMQFAAQPYTPPVTLTRQRHRWTARMFRP
ncbi:minor capsid protein [Salmonella phage 37]|uniref:Minor capsid protein n=1 Tax=Salmonella phage 37 TaxID=1654890 RepID=A0A0N7C9W4_9CAUD|nr:tail protein [Salmonella phage 37]AKJ73914.1 minor capsid protein [Salmonella phage 37]